MKTTKKERELVSAFSTSAQLSFASSRFCLLFSYLFPIFIDIILNKNQRYES